MITQMIFNWAKQTPDKTAIIYNGKAFSYQLFAHLIGVARGYFVRRGYTGPGYAVLAFFNLLDYWVFSLALRSLGLTTVPVESVARVGKLGLPGVRCVITSPGKPWIGLDSLCTELGLPLLPVSLADETALGLDAFEAPHPIGGHILRTSGTTGIHKMVLMNSDFDAAIVPLQVKLFDLNHNSLLSLFDYAAGAGHGYKWAASAWSVGGAIAIDQWGKPYDALLHPGITHAVLTPATLATILAAPEGAFPLSHTLQVAVGAGAITRTQVDQAKARITPRIFNYVASTEAGIITFTPLDGPEDLRWHRLVPERVVEIVDDSDRPVSIGEVGRVRVGTAGGPTGYLHDDEATQTFFKDGFFYPGDLAIIRSDGRMALQGRVTDVINLGGAKISPAPIEEQLSEVFGVSGVCLFSMQNDNGEEEIHVVIESPTPIEPDRLNAVINQELCGFPRARIHYVTALPRNQFGKVLRQAVRTLTIAH